MPHYKKVFDIGTYTGNGGQYRVGIPTLRGPGPTGTQVAGSVRFRSSNNNYMNRTPASTTNRTTWTWSAWVKIGSIQDQHLYAAGVDGNNRDIIEFNVGGSLNGTFNFQSLSGAVTQFQLTSTVFIRDSSQWYHFMVVVDTSNATSTQRVLSYINGVRVTSFGTANYPSQNYATNTNTNNIHTIGRRNYTASSFFDGYMAEVNFIDGQALTPSSFGEYNSDGIWVPKAYSSTYGTNGYYLKFAPGSAGTDSSGNGNTWTLNGFNVSTANTTYDLMTDSPTDYLSGSMSTANNAGNYATLNANDNGGATLSSGGLQTVSGSATWYSTRSTIGGITSGKWYWEGSLTVGGQFHVGICSIYTTLSTYFGSQAAGYAYNAADGLKYNNNSTAAYGATFTAGDVIGVAFDADNGALYFSKNGTWQNSGDPTSGSSKTGAAYTGLTSGPYSPVFGIYSSTAVVNFGQRAFAYTPPTGYKSLNTYNITRPADSSLWFYGDTPDMIWIKNRSASSNNVITDTVRGIGINLVTNARAPDLSYPAVSEMNKFGMSVINDSVSVVNGSGNSHVYWGWKANSSTTVTDTSGTITSQVSANRQAGFSIVSWIYNSSGGTIGHGLGAAPSFIIQRSRTTGYNWDVYHVSLGPTKRLTLNTTSASETFTGPWNDTSPTSSVFSSGASWWTNGDSMITYCWTAIPGYSAFGSYVGSGGADGPYVYLGFRPRWLLGKRTDAANDWLMWDSTRDTYNLMQNIIYANATTAESTYVNDKLDFVSNGIKLRNVGSAMNASGGTYIYAAFAESPFKFARAR